MAWAKAVGASAGGAPGSRAREQDLRRRNPGGGCRGTAHKGAHPFPEVVEHRVARSSVDARDRVADVRESHIVAEVTEEQVLPRPEDIVDRSVAALVGEAARAYPRA